MNTSLKSILKIVLPLGLGVFLIYLFYRGLKPKDIADMKNAVANANYWWLLLSVSFTMISQTIRSFRWKALIKATGNEITALRAFNAISVNYIVNLGLPRAGELARCGVLTTYNDIPINKSIGTVVNERISDLIMLLIVGILAFFLQYQIFIDFYNTQLAKQYQPLLNWFENHLILTISVSIVIGMAGLFLLRWMLKSKNDAESKLGKIIQGFKEGILSIFKLEKPILFILQTIAIWLCYFLMTYFAFKTISQGHILGFDAALSLLFFGTIGFLITPGGIGTYPWIAGLLLSLYGLEVHLGSTMGWILWVGQTTLIILTGLMAFLILGREKKFKSLVLDKNTNDL